MLNNDEWAAFTPPPQIDAELNPVRHQIRCWDCEAQGGPLQDLLNHQGNTDFVASLMSLWSEEAGRHFYSVAYNGTGAALLPEADILVGFNLHTMKPEFSLWSDVVKHDPKCLVRTAWWPPRWRIERPPKLPGGCVSDNPKTALRKLIRKADS